MTLNSEELKGLEPQTNRDFLVLMWDTQKTILGHCEDFNEWKDQTEGRVTRLEERQKAMSEDQSGWNKGLILFSTAISSITGTIAAIIGIRR